MLKQPRLARTALFLQTLSHVLLLAIYATTVYAYRLHFWMLLCEAERLTLLLKT